MRVAICDDEKDCLDYLHSFLQRNSNISGIVGITNYTDLRNLIEDKEQYDIVFMDIEWKELKENGIDYAREIHSYAPTTQIIYVTGYNDKFSQDIFLEKVNLCGYLVKPVNEERLNLFIERAMHNIRSFAEEKILIESKKGSFAIPFRTIRYVESKAHQVTIYVGQESYTFYGKLEELKKKFPPYFIPCHKSYFLNMNEVRRMEGHEFVLRDESRIPISKAQFATAKKQFFEYIKNII